MRLYGLVSALAPFHQISVLSFVTRAESPVPALQGLRGLCERVVTVQNDRLAVRGISRRALQLGSALSPRSFRDLVHHRGSLQAAIGRMAQDATYDVVQVEHSFMARYAFPPEAVMVLDEHNVEYEIPLRSVTVDGSLPRKLYDRLEYLKVRAEEEGAWRRVDACAVTSSRDAVTIRRAFPHALVDVVPNGVDTRYFSPGDRPSEPATLLFFGTIASYPNVDALLFFVREVLPLIRRAHPAVRLVIVGPAPPPEIRRLSGPDVVVTDAVPDLRPYLERASARRAAAPALLDPSADSANTDDNRRAMRPTRCRKIQHSEAAASSRCRSDGSSPNRIWPGSSVRPAVGSSSGPMTGRPRP